MAVDNFRPTWLPKPPPFNCRNRQYTRGGTTFTGKLPIVRPFDDALKVLIRTVRRTRSAIHPCMSENHPVVQDSPVRNPYVTMIMQLLYNDGDSFLEPEKKLQARGFPPVFRPANDTALCDLCALCVPLAPVCQFFSGFHRRLIGRNRSLLQPPPTCQVPKPISETCQPVFPKVLYFMKFHI